MRSTTRGCIRIDNYKNMIDIKDKNDCCGCCACVDSCPKNAISLAVDNEGFWYPKVDIKLCIDCGLCDKVCPELHVDELKKNDYNEPKCFAAINESLDVRFDSTSGGLFSALADKIYKDGGYVGGAIFNPDFSVRHFISNDKKDLPALRSSKYLQSDASGLYKEVKRLLKQDEKVLVCGTPCQMAALRSFLGRDYDNLIIVDFICLGINSPKIFRKYLDYLEREHKSKVIYFKAKNKELGWRQLTSKIVFENGVVHYDTKDTSYFTKGYIGTHAYSRPSCYECKFKGFPRMADITIADFWGAEKAVGQEYDNDLGTSLVLVNSHKGEEYYNSIKKKSTPVPIDSIKGGNRALFHPISYPNIDRVQFFVDLDKYDFDIVAKRYIVSSSLSAKDKIKNVLRFLNAIRVHCGFNVVNIMRNIKLNFFTKNIQGSIFKGVYIIATPYTILNISKKAKLNINGSVVIGSKRIKSSKLETRFLVEDGGTFTSGSCNIGYGSDVQVFKNAELVIGNGCASNINTTIICGDSIELGSGVMVGRNVTIRDNNGGHYLAMRGYKTTKPVVIGEHSWLCESSTIMQGTKLGTGVIVGGGAFVQGGKFKSHTVLSGNPAKVVDENVYWKY